MTDVFQDKNVSEIEYVMYNPSDKCFFVITNIYEQKLGLYVIEFKEESPLE